MSEPCDGLGELRDKIIGLGEKSIRKSYYPELQLRVEELESTNRRLSDEIDARRKSEDLLREAEERFRTLFQAMTEMVVLHTLVRDETGRAVDYRIMDCNDAFLQNMGIGSSEAVGMLGSALYGESPPPRLAEYESVCDTGRPFCFTEQLRRNGRQFSVSVVSPKRGSFATIMTDVSEIARAHQRLNEKNRELESYLYVASHDLRSPLVNIQGFSERLKSQTELIRSALGSASLGGEAQETLDRGLDRSLSFIFTNVTKMDRLINGLLQISRTGRLRLSVRKLDMNRLLSGVIGSFAYQIEEVEAEVDLALVPDCYGDENLVNQLFSNLVANAIKYRDSGRPLRLAIGGETTPQGIAYWVRDNGVGIPEKYLSRVWDVFFRVGGDSTVQGDGIGLSIVKRIVEKHLGEIGVSSVDGQGTEFRVTLPAAEFAEEE